MKQPPPDYEPDDGDSHYSSAENDPRADKLNKRITVVFACIVLSAILITIIALLLDR